MNISPGAGEDSNLRQPLPGIDREALCRWLESNLDVRAPFHFELIIGGHSNLTYRVIDASGTVMVLRRPPLGVALASAHDVGREQRIITALSSSNVAVPRVLAASDDPAVTGAPFFIMEYVEGLVLRTPADASSRLGAACGALSEHLIDSLVALHGIDSAAVGLDALGRPDGYVVRQLARWHRQYQSQHATPIPAIDRVHSRLAASVPEQRSTRIVHGDYRVDNCIIGISGQIEAILDWELCTLGDPLADLATMLVYWTGPDDEPSAWLDTPTTAMWFWPRRRLVDRYAAQTGADMSSLNYFIAFASWRLACVLTGVHARSIAGALGGRDHTDVERLGYQASLAATQAEATLEGHLRLL